MNEQLKRIIDPIKNFWGKLTKRTKIIIFSCLGAVVLLAVVMSLLMNRTQYTVLYSGLDTDETKEVTTELKTLDVPFKNESGTIYVDKNKENSVRMQLSNEGYPKSAPNYNFFTTNVGVMTTDEERKIIEQYQLQERLGAVIKTLDPVDTAYVTISVPSSSTYAWDDNKETATASVAVKLKEGRSLDAKQVGGIKQLVTKSVPNLKAENVSIVDSSSGEELSSSSAANANQSSGSTQITLSEFKLKIEKQYEDNVQGKIQNLLAQAYGANNISVSVKSKMDLDKKIQDIVTYTPSTSDGKGMVSQSAETHEVTQPASSKSGGVAGTQSNSDTTTTYPGVSVNGNVITTKDSKTYNYLVNQVEEQIQSDAAALDDLSVAVMINTNSMTSATQQQLTNLVAKAAAVDASKVAVMAVANTSSSENSQATQTSANLNIPQLLMNNPVILIAGGAFLLLLILLIALIASKRNRERREKLIANLQQAAPVPVPQMPIPQDEETEEDDEDEDENEDGSEDEGEDDNLEEDDEEPMPTESIEELRNANTGKEQRVKSDLQDFSSKNPEIAAQLIRSWLRGDDNKHG